MYYKRSLRLNLFMRRGELLPYGLIIQSSHSRNGSLKKMSLPADYWDHLSSGDFWIGHLPRNEHGRRLEPVLLAAINCFIKPPLAVTHAYRPMLLTIGLSLPHTLLLHRELPKSLRLSPRHLLNNIILYLLFALRYHRI